MNMKRAHANHIAENQAIIAELTRRLADRDEVQKQQHKELLAHQDLQLSQSKEISRLKALCTALNEIGCTSTEDRIVEIAIKELK